MTTTNNPQTVELTTRPSNGQTQTFIPTTTAVPLRRPQTAIEKAEQDARDAFKPNPHPCCTAECCGKNMWRYYCCPDGSKEQSCCDVDHLSMHIFFLALVGSIALVASGISSADQSQVPTATYFGGMGFSIAVCVWAFWQINRILTGRMDAAKLMDINVEFKTQRGNLDNNIQTASDVRDKLAQTHEKTAETTGRLKQKFIELKTWTDQSKILTDQNSKVAILLADKIYKMERDIEDELIASEKGVIEALYNSMHLRDGNKGLDETEFREFLNRLPKKYKERFKFDLKFNFSQEAGQDGILDRRELDRFMEQTIRDIALEQEAKDVPIAEEIDSNVEDDGERVTVPLTGDGETTQ